MKKIRTAMLATLVMTLLSTVTFAAGARSLWKVTDVTSNTLTVEFASGVTYTIDGNNEDMRGLRNFFGVSTNLQMKGRQLEGTDIEETLNRAAQWGLNMTLRDKQNELIAEGIIQFKNVNLPKNMILDKSDFPKQQVDLSRLAEINHRVEVKSNYRRYVKMAFASDFNVLPQGLYWAPLQVMEKIVTKDSAMTPYGEEGPVYETISWRVHRFTLSGESTNAVQFDLMELNGEEMN